MSVCHTSTLGTFNHNFTLKEDTLGLQHNNLLPLNQESKFANCGNIMLPAGANQTCTPGKQDRVYIVVVATSFFFPPASECRTKNAVASVVGCANEGERGERTDEGASAG